jgi:hypothetical protein
MSEVLRIRMPGAAAAPRDDARYCVELQPAELSWPVRFYFLQTEDQRWATVGVELGLRTISREAIEEGLDSDDAELRAKTIRWVAANFERYESEAKTALSGGAMAPEARSGDWELTPEHLRHFARRYRELVELNGRRGVVKQLAIEYGRNPSTIWRWKKAAREAEYLTENE